MSIDDEPEETAELAVFETLKRGVVLLRPITRVVLAQIGIVLAAILVIDLVAGLAFGALWSGDPPSSSSGTADVLAQIAGAILGWALVANIVLGISRWALYGERPAVPDLIRWNARQARLLGVGIVGFLLIFVPGLVVVLASDPATGQPAIAMLLSLVWALYAVWFLSWFALATPLVASDEPLGVMEQVWRTSRGHRLPLLAIAVLILLPMGILMSVVTLVAPSSAGPWLMLLAALFQFMVVYGVGIFYAAVATAAWARLTAAEADAGEGAAPEPPAPAPASAFNVTSGFSQGAASFATGPGRPVPAATSEETVPPRRSSV